MSSTKKPLEQKDRQIRKFFDEVVIPVAQKLRERGIAFFALQPDASAQSYFTPYPSDIDIVEIETDAIPSLLKEHWKQEQLPELVELVDPLLELASVVADERPPDEVSPFIYVMF